MEAEIERLIWQEYRRVASVAFRITRDEVDAEDVAADVFAKFLRARLANAGGVRAWLFQTAVAAALEASRHCERAERHTVRAALVRLGTDDAEVLAFRYGGLAYREIADIIGIDEAEVGTRLSRAERALKREMEREAFERRRFAPHDRRTRAL